jgi:hypothetical protein
MTWADIVDVVHSSPLTASLHPIVALAAVAAAAAAVSVDVEEVNHAVVTQ